MSSFIYCKLPYRFIKKGRTLPGHVPTFLGWFWVRVHNVAYVRPCRAKMGPKTIIFIHGDKALNVSSFNLSRKNKQFKKEYHNRIKNDRFMPIKRSHAKVAVGLFWAKNWLFWSDFLRYRLQYRFL